MPVLYTRDALGNLVPIKTIRGSIGPIGPRGDLGPQGDKGDKGDIGEKGELAGLREKFASIRQAVAGITGIPTLAKLSAFLNAVKKIMED